MGLQKKRETYISVNDDLIKFKHDEQIDREKASESSENKIAFSELGYGIFFRWISNEIFLQCKH